MCELTDAEMPECGAPIPSKGKQRIGALLCRERAIETQTTILDDGSHCMVQLEHELRLGGLTCTRYTLFHTPYFIRGHCCGLSTGGVESI